jgi:hypothetical protein
MLPGCLVDAAVLLGFAIVEGIAFATCGRRVGGATVAVVLGLTAAGLLAYLSVRYWRRHQDPEK